MTARSWPRLRRTLDLMSNATPSVKFDIQVASTIEEIDQAAWDQLGQTRPFSSYRWYRFGEVVLTRDRSIYVTLSLGGEPVARATFWLKTEEPVDDVPRIVANYLLPMILRRWPLLACRSPLSSSSGLILPDDPSLREAALEVITQIGQDLAQKHRASFLLFDYLSQEESEWPIWPAPLVPVTIPQPGTHLPIEWPDFESYLSSLPRKRRKHYRQHLRYGEEMGVEVKLCPRVSDVDTAMTLIQNVEDKYAEQPFYWTRSLLENADLVDSVWITAEAKGRLVGCELMVGDRGGWRVMALGRDYEFDFVYFLLAYADIRYAIENGGQVLYWGTCAYDVKRRLGFELEDNNYIVFAGRRALLHKFARWVASMMQSSSLEISEFQDATTDQFSQ